MATNKNQRSQTGLFELHRNTLGQWYFLIRGRNSKVIAQSQMYTRKENCVKGMLAVVRRIRRAPDVNPLYFGVITRPLQKDKWKP